MSNVGAKAPFMQETFIWISRRNCSVILAPQKRKGGKGSGEEEGFSLPAGRPLWSPPLSIQASMQGLQFGNHSCKSFIVPSCHYRKLYRNSSLKFSGTWKWGGTKEEGREVYPVPWQRFRMNKRFLTFFPDWLKWEIIGLSIVSPRPLPPLFIVISFVAFRLKILLITVTKKSNI